MKKQCGFLASDAEKVLIQQAAKRLSISFADFVRMSALEKARHILKENKEEAVQQQAE